MTYKQDFMNAFITAIIAPTIEESEAALERAASITPGNDVVQQIRDIAAQQPERRYDDSCVYVIDSIDGPQPGCIVGHALWALGLADETWLGKKDNRSAVLRLPLALDWAHEDTVWVQRVQNLQDDGVPWGLAVELADNPTLWDGCTLLIELENTKWTQ